MSNYRAHKDMRPQTGRADIKLQPSQPVASPPHFDESESIGPVTPKMIMRSHPPPELGLT
jgi:hypothetical protein